MFNPLNAKLGRNGLAYRKTNIVFNDKSFAPAYKVIKDIQQRKRRKADIARIAYRVDPDQLGTDPDGNIICIGDLATDGTTYGVVSGLTTHGYLVTSNNRPHVIDPQCTYRIASKDVLSI